MTPVFPSYSSPPGLWIRSYIFDGYGPSVLENKKISYCIEFISIQVLNMFLVLHFAFGNSWSDFEDVIIQSFHPVQQDARSNDIHRCVLGWVKYGGFDSKEVVGRVLRAEVNAVVVAGQGEDGLSRP